MSGVSQLQANGNQNQATQSALANLERTLGDARQGLNNLNSLLDRDLGN